MVDLVIADLADENALLREWIASLETDLGVYREIAVAALDAVRELTVRNQSLVSSRARLLDELHAYREHALVRAGADDVAAA